jgi:hypothetical protein
MIRKWQAIEAKAAERQQVTIELLSEVLYSALQTFYLAVSVERYYEMSIAVSTMGLVHRMITGSIEIMADCYERAAECAGWLGDSELRDFFANANLALAKEILDRK